MKQIMTRVGALVLASVASVPALAVDLDTTASVAFLNGDVKTGIIAIGGALLVLAALAMGYKWVKATIFG